MRDLLAAVVFVLALALTAYVIGLLVGLVFLGIYTIT
ncbi:MAG: hypothetical protein SHS37scaffold537_26 [Phage 68_12]|jgi:hypothetical protein|nr:MAG: hypothetical protein SHS37scaffold537_26 [Phage 68_12]